MKKKVIVITGPTAVGKTKLSIEIAKNMHTDLINADAYQIYKNMNIGTAKPTIEEMQGIKHHFLDFLPTDNEYSISEYQKDVRSLIDRMHEKNKLPILVGGSGLYIDTIVKDYRFDESKRDEDVEKQYYNLNNEELHQILQKLDSNLANKIHPNNRKRVLRAIELSNSSVSKTSRSLANDYYYDTLCIFLNDDRERLYQRINTRIDEMVNNGLIDEIKNIGINNFSRTSSQAIGYKEIISYLNGEINLDDAIDNIKKNSRHYAKRQFTWFKNKTDAVIVNIDVENFKNTIDEVLELIEKFINN